jgi:phosphohistidine swiveling domain-containing protein
MEQVAPGELRFWDDARPWRAMGGKSKATNLRLLKQRGFNVPPFFAVTGAFADRAAFDEALLSLFQRKRSLAAVRSSGLAEDSDECAMAGENLTVLGVPGNDSDACWAALLRVASSSKKEASIPVLVQQQSDARFAGVVFTRHPLTGANVLVVNVAAGLGEKIVGGEVSPCQIVLDKTTHAELSREGPVIPELPSLADLARNCVEIEAVFGRAMDIEFCLEGPECRVTVLQARPITTILHAPASLPEGTVLANDHTKEVMGSVLTPLTFTAFHVVIDKAFRTRCDRLGLVGYGPEQSYYELVGGCLFQNVNLTYELYKEEFGSLSDVASLCKEFSSVPPDVLSQWQPSGAVVAPLWNVFKMVWGAKNREAEHEASVNSHREFCLANGSAPFEQVFERLCAFAADYIDIQVYCFFFLALVESSSGGPGSALPYISMLEGVETAQQAEEFRTLVLLARERGFESAEFGEQFGAFRVKWGFRAINELEIASKRWSDDPSYLLETLQKQAESEQPPLAENVERPEPGGVVFPYLVRRLQGFARLRENSKAVVVRYLALCRKRAVEMAAGHIEDPEDVFFLTLPQLRALGTFDARTAVAEAKKVHAQHSARSATLPDALVVRDGVFAPLLASQGPAGSNSAELVGTVASAGKAVVRGVARVLHDPSEGGKLNKGDILLCCTTDPGWTVLFWQCAAVVTERGGILSHAAITAREMRVPALVGVAGLLRANLDGKRVCVDFATASVEEESNEK